MSNYRCPDCGAPPKKIVGERPKRAPDSIIFECGAERCEDGTEILNPLGCRAYLLAIKDTCITELEAKIAEADILILKQVALADTLILEQEDLIDKRFVQGVRDARRIAKLTEALKDLVNHAEFEFPRRVSKARSSLNHACNTLEGDA